MGESDQEFLLVHMAILMGDMDSSGYSRICVQVINKISQTQLDWVLFIQMM